METRTMLKLMTSLPALMVLLLARGAAADDKLLISEGFEDTMLSGRGCYDGDRFALGDDAAVGKHAIRYHFPSGKLNPSDSSGVRHLLEPTEAVYLRFYLKFSPEW